MTVHKLDPKHPDPSIIENAASIIRAGGLVAFPTETVYGLGADAMNEQAVNRIFHVKGRPADNPVIVHVSGRKMLDRVGKSVSAAAEKLIERFWPGPLTLVLERKPGVAVSVSAGLPTVAARMPRSKIALNLIQAADTPIAAPSANLSGRPSPTRAAHVEADLGDKIDMILDGGETEIGIESTVVDMTSMPPAILRPGWITGEMLAEVIGPIEAATSTRKLKHSPGTRHRHYSPKARVILMEKGSGESIERICREYLGTYRVGFIGHTRVSIDNPRFKSLILEDSAKVYARSIFSAMREMDDWGAEVVVIEGISEEGGGAAVMDRLRRAASIVTEP